MPPCGEERSALLGHTSRPPVDLLATATALSQVIAEQAGSLIGTGDLVTLHNAYRILVDLDAAAEAPARPTRPAGGSVRCPYPDCRFTGSDEQVDDHRAYAHQSEPQQGSNL